MSSFFIDVQKSQDLKLSSRASCSFQICNKSYMFEYRQHDVDCCRAIFQLLFFEICIISTLLLVLKLLVKISFITYTHTHFKKSVKWRCMANESE